MTLMTENQIKEILYFCYKENVEVPEDLIKNNDIIGLNKYFKEHLYPEYFEDFKISAKLYTNINGENMIDFSELPYDKEKNKVEHINIDYKQFIGKKIPFVYNNVSGELEIVGVEMVYTEDASNKIDSGYVVFENEYGKNLLIISKYMLKYKEKVVALSTADLMNINLSFFDI